MTQLRFTDSFFNTNNEEGTVLEKSIRTNLKQEDEVLQCLNDCHESVTPEFIWRYTGMEARNIPLTSIRRALTVLASKEKAEKTPLMKMGSMGKMIHTWKKASPKAGLF